MELDNLLEVAMSTENQQIIIDYPDDFPISGPLRAVFTERLRTFFDGCSTWSCSSDGSLPEKLLKLRKEMQESIHYPPQDKSNVLGNECGVIEPCAISFIALPEELLSWKGLQAKSMKDLSPIVRNAGLEMASRILGLQIHYGETDVSNQEAEPECADLSVDGWPWPAQLCPFSLPKRIGVLTKNWSAGDREKLIHVIKRHVETAALAAFVIGLVLGLLVAASGHPHHKTYNRSSTAWESSYGVPNFPHALTPPVPAGFAAPQPQSSLLAAPPRQDVAPRQGVITTGPFRQEGTTPGVSTP